jgi:hypothetical protein
LLRRFQKYAKTPFIWWFFQGDKNAKINCVAKATTTRRRTRRKTNTKMRQQNTL